MYKTFKEMPVWQKAIEAAETVHDLTRIKQMTGGLPTLIYSLRVSK
jgi:hypothetical protein